MRTLSERLTHWADRQPDAVALISPETGRLIRYQELFDQTRQLAGLLAALGIDRGRHVGLYLQNGLQTTRLFLSIMSAGYVATPFNLLSQRDQLAWVLDHSDCDLVFYGAAQKEMLTAAIAKMKRPLQILQIDADAAELVIREADVPDYQARDVEMADPAQPALLMYTSGTTGTPKGVRLSHANLTHAAESVSSWHGLGPADRVLSSLPIYHINGQSIATVTPFYSGGSIVAAQKFSVSQWWSAVREHQCTWINMVPTIIAYLLNAKDGPDAPKADDLRFVRFGRSASAPLPPEHHRAFEERFGIAVIEAMGMTESASVVFCNPHDQRRRYGSPGLPCGVEAKVIGPAGEALPSGETGELCLRGANVMDGYYKSADETRKAFDLEGWLRTGDLGYRDADGFYFVTGRLKELIIKGGENIAPREIDEALLGHPAVLDAACVGIADANYGQEIIAFVILKEGAQCSDQELREFCISALGKFKTPRDFHFVADLPRGASGKVQRLRLIEGMAQAR